MNCNQLDNIFRGCDNNMGGIQKFYVAAYNDVAVATEAVTGDGIIDTITMASTSPAAEFVEFEFKKGTSSFVEDATLAQEGGTEYIPTSTIMLHRRDVDKRNALALLAAGQQNLFIIIKDQNDIYWAQGWLRGANLTAIGEGSGTVGTDGSKYSLTFVGAEPQAMPQVSDSAMATLPGITL